MAEQFVQVAADGGGKKIRSIESTVGGNVVEQQVVGDVFNGGEVLADQSGANGVLTFTFAAPVHMLWIRSDGAVSRADPFGGTPTVSLGIYCDDGVPQPVTVTATVVKVYAPSGATVRMWAFRY